MYFVKNLLINFSKKEIKIVYTVYSFWNGKYTTYYIFVENVEITHLVNSNKNNYIYKNCKYKCTYLWPSNKTIKTSAYI